MLHIYYVRKLDEKNFKKIKSLWKEKKLEQPSYEKWLLKTFRTQYGTVLNDRALNILHQEKFENIFEAGCGAGASALVHLLRIFDLRYPNGKLNQQYKSITYTGVDLNITRVENARKYLPIFFNYYKSIVNFILEEGDLTNLKFKDDSFDFTFIPSVLERVSEKEIDAIIREICRVSKNYIFITDFYDQYPLGYPRSEKELSKYFNKYGFKIEFFEYKMTDTYMPNQCELHIMFKKFK
jgi:ubiquinone/menaquinone biosynthesis C-methylase UbiE